MKRTSLNSDLFADDNSWKSFIDHEMQLPYFRKIKNKLLLDKKGGNNIFPEESDIFRAFSLTDPKNIKVCIIGQDPYHTPNVACGIAFGIRNANKIPPSLMNIMKEVKSDLLDSKLSDYELLSWCKQGVFLINTCLTVLESKPGSHFGIGWETFVENSIKHILIENKFIVFFLWGKKAQNFFDKLKNKATSICSQKYICAMKSV